METETRKSRRASSRKAETIVGRLKAADPFELIRWLARSQPDPRKALAELVQNAIDAQARRIHITRIRERAALCLHVLDDGEGVIPELERTAALTYVATHVGHSRKRNLTPEQRRELMLQGKYGIGLLGFWAIGSELEIRTQMPEQRAYLLRLHEDSPRYEIEPLRGRLPFGERHTEVVVRGLHRAAGASLSVRRMADYLATELRGQLLQRDIELLVHDRIARGRTQKVLQVKPERYAGARLDLPEEHPCAGFSPLRVELYRLPEGLPEEGRISISSAGTIVYDDVTEFDLADFRRIPWSDPRLNGLVDFPDFQVPPGSRRGVIPDAAALAFVEAMRSLETRIGEQLRADAARAVAEVEADLVKQLERAFRDVPKLAPEYDFFAVRGRTTPGFAGPAPENGEASKALSDAAGVGEVLASTAVAPLEVDHDDEAEPATLFPPGPLESLSIVPVKTRVEVFGERRLRAEARDAQGVRIRGELSMAWRVSPELGSVEPHDGRATVFHAGADAGLVTVSVVAREGERTAYAEAAIEIVEQISPADSSRAGIPEPAFVNDPTGNWRSRMLDGHWDVNSGHPDFTSASETARRKLRYLAALLAKEVVLHSFPGPQLAPALERLIEVLTITERRLERG
jgi:hypothetical protein